MKQNKKRLIHHLNYYDSESQIYCRKENKITKQDIKKCEECDFLYGALQGRGVECMWEDISEISISTVINPQEEYLRVNKLIEDKYIV